MAFPGSQLWVFVSTFLRVAKQNDMECFLISLMGVSLSSAVLVEKDWGLFKKFLLGLEGETNGELVKTEQSELDKELSKEQLEDVLGNEPLDNSDGKLVFTLRFSGFLVL